MNRKDRRAEAARQRHAQALVGMELRYGGRTLVITAYVNTSEEFTEVVKRVQPAARGPKQAMVILTAKVYEAEQASLVADLWKAQGIQTLFDGRTVVIACYVNTDEEAARVSARVIAAANKPTDPAVCSACLGQLAVITTVGDAPEEETRAMWEKFFATLRARKDGPN